MKKRVPKFSVILVAIALAILGARLPKQQEPFDGLRVHFVDVGQADCNLIELPNGQNLLIDAGNNDDGNDVVRYLKQQGIETLDYVIGTHPHEDHIGGLDTVISSFSVGSVYLPRAETTTKTFRDVLDAVKEKGLKIKTAKAGVTLLEEDELSVRLLAPCRDEYDSLNNYSAVVRIVYGDTAFLFMGDAEKQVEKEIEGEVSADVLKIGHHGSSSSTSKAFLERISPQYVYIPCGENNDYGHPHKETVKLLSKHEEISVFRADRDGTVVFDSDGKTVSVPLALLPQGAKEGDVLEIRVSGRKTEERKQEIHALAEELWED